jgi:hypothetical protein
MDFSEGILPDSKWQKSAKRVLFLDAKKYQTERRGE